MNKRLAIIPARGGSKRIPHKNIKLFMNQPIIKYSIDAALNSKLFDEVMVSTDDMEIARISQACGAAVPFYRSTKKADDYATVGDVVEEVILEYKKRGQGFEYLCCILATVPFIKTEYILKTFELLEKSNADSVIPVVRFNCSIQRALKIEAENLKMFWPENYNMRSQDLTPAYHDSGQFYWMRVNSFLKQKKIFAENSIPFVMQDFEAQDIDTPQDWAIAEFKYKYLEGLKTK